MTTALKVVSACSLLVALPLALHSPCAGQELKIPDDGPEVYTTSTGLKHSLLAPGNGKPGPALGDLVRFHYSGWLTDGSLFETSRTQAAPRVMTLGVFMPKAWVEAFPLLSPGARIKLVVPPHLGYGKVGSPGNPPNIPAVPPDATLVFEIELDSFEKGVDLPAYRIANLAKQKSTDSGLKFEVIVPGRGDRPAEGERFTVEFALFNERGQLVSTSATPHEPPIVGRQGASLHGPDFLPEAIGMLRLGERIRFEVPAEMAFGRAGRGYLVPPGSVTIWELELTKLDPAPAPREVPAMQRPERGKTKQTPSGLRYQVLEAGTGRVPGPKDTVEYHSAGWLGSGKMFAETFSKGVPARLDLEDEKLIEGLREGLQRMRIGSVYLFAIPSALAYGLRGQKELEIGPNRRLYYRIELLSISAAR